MLTWCLMMRYSIVMVVEGQYCFLGHLDGRGGLILIEELAFMRSHQ